MVFVTPLPILKVKLTVVQVFWISYNDLLKHFQQIDRTRLFGADWYITQHWTSADIPWAVRYLDTRFRITISEASPVVIMLCQVRSLAARPKVG